MEARPCLEITVLPRIDEPEECCLGFKPAKATIWAGESKAAMLRARSVVKTEEPPKRLAGVKVKSVAELVSKLKEAGAI